MKYQISNTASNPRWVDNYVLHHYTTPVHNHLKSNDVLDVFYSSVASERNKMWIKAAEAVGAENIYLEDNQVWVDIPETAETTMWMLTA
jgi:hypothetical protein